MKRAAVLLLAFTVSSAPVRAADAVPRLALVASGHGDAGKIAALMEVALSRSRALVLLERAETDRILAEHKLQLDGLLSAEDALTLILRDLGLCYKLHGDVLQVWTGCDT